jgi:hypothetical protein
LPVQLVVSSEAYEKPGLDKPTRWKEYLGEQYVSLLEDNHLTLPPEAYVRADHRLVIKDRGRFVCESDSLGRHGDTFDAAKLSVHALSKASYLTEAEGMQRILARMRASNPNPLGPRWTLRPDQMRTGRQYNPWDPETRELRRKLGLPNP